MRPSLRALLALTAALAAACAGDPAAPTAASDVPPPSLRPIRGGGPAPIVDGYVDELAGEYAGGAEVVVPVNFPPGETTVGGAKLLLTSDGAKLYIAMKLQRNDGFDPGNRDFVDFEFDADRDGRTSFRDDVLLATTAFATATRYGDNFWSRAAGARPDTWDGGTEDVLQAFGDKGGVGVFELSHPLFGRDRRHDMLVVPTSRRMGTIPMRVLVGLHDPSGPPGALTLSYFPGPTSYCLLTVNRRATTTLRCP